jgi:hypothetical protein
VEITHVMRRRRPTAPPSLRAQILLVASAFLSGAVLAALLFVGVWRHTAADGDRAHAQEAATRRVALTAQHRLSVLKTRLEQEHAALLAAQRRERGARAAAAAQHATLAAIDRALPPRLAAAETSARTLVTKLAALRSELAALESYLRRPGPAGLDEAYLMTQVRYLSASADAAASAASAGVRQSQAAAAAAATVGHK